MSKHSLQIKTTLTRDNLSDFEKIYLLDATHSLIVLQQYDTPSIPICIELKISKQQSNIDYTLSLFSFSNEAQKYVAIENSWLIGTKVENWLEDIALEYKPILDNFANILESIKYADQLKELLYRMENITNVFHYKLLNMFTQEELEAISIRLYKSFPRLNVALLKSQENLSLDSDLFLPHYHTGFYAHEIEISTDLDKSDYPTIEYEAGDNKSSLTKQEILKVFGVDANIQT